jgi:hypothetical protein
MRETGIAEMKRRSKMDLNSIKRTILAAVCVLALSSVNAVAQEIRSEISLQGTGFFTKDADGNGIRQHATDTGGFLVGYRYNFNRWLAAEANYGYDRNTQIYFGGTGARVESNIHQITGSAVVKLPSLARLQPYALAGAALWCSIRPGMPAATSQELRPRPGVHSFTALVPTTLSPGTSRYGPSTVAMYTKHQISISRA